MKATKTSLLSAVIILSALISPVNAYREVIDLGTLPGYDHRSIARSINDNGQIVGDSFNIESGSQHACLFDSTGGGANTDLGTLPGYDYGGTACSINDNGQIVGYAYGSSGWQHACLFDSTGGGANIDPDPAIVGPPPSSASCAYSINNKGQIVGQDHGLACLFDPTGGGANINLGALDSFPFTGSVAYSINDNGQIVGEDYLVGTNRACLFDPTGGGANINLGGLGGASWANSNNNNGQIVGSSYNGYPTHDPPDPILHACLFDPTGGRVNTDLGALGSGGSEAEFINDEGQIVGYAYDISYGGPPFYTPTYSNYRACLFDPTGGGANIDLNTLIDPASSWVLTRAYCINNSGWIVGCGTNPDGDTHAYLLTPEPTSAVIMAIGVFALRRRRR